VYADMLMLFLLPARHAMIDSNYAPALSSPALSLSLSQQVRERALAELS